jgi:hypothetical protein
MWPERFCFSENASSENSAEEGRCAVALIKGELPKLTATCLQFTSVLSGVTCTGALRNYSLKDRRGLQLAMEEMIYPSNREAAGEADRIYGTRKG